ncbi:MAG: protease modulator HflC [Gemmatimonadetes bacterium]|nr:protease modulator HflC [Gemmatimonadota bacterium]
MKSKWFGAVGPLMIFLILFVPQGVFIVDETEQAIITQFGEYKRTIKEPGLHMKLPLVQTINRFERRVLVSDAAPAEYLTGDKKRVVVDHITRWKIADPLAFFKSVRTEVAGQARLAEIVSSELRKELALHEFTDIISKQRDLITATVAKGASEKAKKLGIEVRDVRIKRADLPKEVQESVFARMVAERERIAKRYRSQGEEEAAKIRASTDKERTIILARAYEESQKLRGVGDAKAARITAEAFGQDAEFYQFLRSLQAYEAMLAENDELVLSADSELLQYLTSPKAAP